MIDTLFPKKIKFPKGGEVYESIEDIELNYIIHHFAPYTNGAKCVFPERNRLIVYPPIENNPVGVYCIPVDYRRIEEEIIPESEKSVRTYSNFSLFIDSEVLTSKFIKIDLSPIRYIKGDATQPIGGDLKIIAHVCNDIGGWGKGFVTALSAKWERPEREYRNWFKSRQFLVNEFVKSETMDSGDTAKKRFGLGNVQFVNVSENIWIANMIAQKNIRKSQDGIPPIRYDSISECLSKVREFAKRNNASVHMPRIGCGLAGGKWEEIEPIIHQELIAHEIFTTVYDFE